jgi:hypothetical protein
MRKRTPPRREESSETAGDLGLAEEPELQPDEAAETVREARRMLEKRPQPSAEAEPETEFPWGPLRPDEKPS